MCFLSDESMYKKVMLFLRRFAADVWQKWKDVCREKKFTQKQTVTFIDNACVFSVSRKNKSNSIILDEENPGSRFALHPYYVL